MSNLKVGDKVEIVGITDEYYSTYNGCKGIIVSMDEGRIMVESTFEGPEAFLGEVEIFEENLQPE